MKLKDFDFFCKFFAFFLKSITNLCDFICYQIQSVKFQKDIE
jgi:hypothetical protein